MREGDRRKYLDQAMKEADKHANEALPQVSLTANDVRFPRLRHKHSHKRIVLQLNFGEVKYLEPIVRSIRIKNIGQFPCEFKFRKRPDAKHKFESWLTVMPGNGRRVKLQPGQEVCCSIKASKKHLLFIEDLS